MTAFIDALSLEPAQRLLLSEEMVDTIWNMFSDSETMIEATGVMPIRNGGLAIEVALKDLGFKAPVRQAYICLFDKDGNLNATISETL